jgi:hypothetical protein
MAQHVTFSFNIPCGVHNILLFCADRWKKLSHNLLHFLQGHPPTLHGWFSSFDAVSELHLALALNFFCSFDPPGVAGFFYFFGPSAASSLLLFVSVMTAC